ncbi:hypothetical protein ACIRQY_12580 [Streptomyces sp. NPDC101490]|uniref:pPIWI_RE_Y domain-containing protein n=1 Tax=Streptomyces sp. NPDC101490 TaxID=3366143 RepID=UPI0038210550
MTTGTAERESGRTGTPGRDRAGTTLFRDLARMVVALSEEEGLRSFSLPYSGLAQYALDRTVAHCIGIGETPPTSLPELWEWCRLRSADDPLFGVPVSFVTPGTTLVHPVGRMPTRACLEIASHGPIGGMAGEARMVLNDLEARAGSTERYRRCRRFLAGHPLVRQGDRGLGWSSTVWSHVRDLYRPLPEFLTVGGAFPFCPECRLPARPRDPATDLPGQPSSHEALWCEGEECPRDQGFQLVRDPGRAVVLRRSLRAFLVLPHRVEEAALDALRSADVEHTPVSGRLAAYRLLGTGSSGTLEIQMHDRVQPALLAAHVADDTDLADRTLVVVPQRAADRVDYRRGFAEGLPQALRGRVALTTPTELVRDLGTPVSTQAGAAPGRSGPAPTPRGKDNDA